MRRQWSYIIIIWCQANEPRIPSWKLLSCESRASSPNGRKQSFFYCFYYNDDKEASYPSSSSTIRPFDFDKRVGCQSWKNKDATNHQETSCPFRRPVGSDDRLYRIIQGRGKLASSRQFQRCVAIRRLSSRKNASEKQQQHHHHQNVRDKLSTPSFEASHADRRYSLEWSKEPNIVRPENCRCLWPNA